MPNDAPATEGLGGSLYKVRRCRHGVMVFLAADDAIGRALDLYGEFAEGEVRAMAPLVQSGDTVIDVGANVGTVTLPLAAVVGTAGTVFSFEPQRLVFHALCASLALNGLDQVHAICSAVGEQQGSVRLPKIDPRCPANYGAVRISATNAGEQVPLTTIDALELPSCKLLKIDAEGMDFAVLRGASATVEQARPFVYTEAKSGRATADTIEWLQVRDYELYWHWAGFFSRPNFRGRDDDVFGGRGDINLIAFPKETAIRPKLPRIAGPHSEWRADYQAFLGSTRRKA